MMHQEKAVALALCERFVQSAKHFPQNTIRQKNSKSTNIRPWLDHKVDTRQQKAIATLDKHTCCADGMNKDAVESKR